MPGAGSSVEQARQLVQCGGTMYPAGTFTTIMKGSTGCPRNNVFSFSATAPYAVTAWAPNVNGTVDSIACGGGNCADAHIGGKFTAVNGAASDNQDGSEMCGGVKGLAGICFLPYGS
ncbi:MAG: hypothetical protein ACLQDY_16580 [Streptosporangiaceae bacterium]